MLAIEPSNQANQTHLPEKLLQMITGVWVTQSIYVAAISRAGSAKDVMMEK
ncbi:MAG: hypothetical protein KME55_29125 [Nostoc indistinguendum CM1-VF10]|jgi:hypothetical protein|nr:hypothetical protein [Nostoc indistinguendum CM1-VF10]